MPNIGARGRAESMCRALLTLGGAAKTTDITALIPEMLPNQSRKAEAFKYAANEGWIIRSDAGRFITFTTRGRALFERESIEGISLSVPLPTGSATTETPIPDTDDNATVIDADVPPNRIYPNRPPVVIDHRELNTALNEIFQAFPQRHRSFARLLVYAVVAKWHLQFTVNDQWPSFVAIGETATGKTTIHNLICRLFGFESLLHMANMTEAQTRGALIGATNSTRTGFMPSPYMELPYACFDELDKAKQIDSVIDPYMHGTVMHFTRGIRYPISPVVLCLANPRENDRYGIIHDAWRRRSVFMNTGGLPESARDMIDAVADMEDVPSGLLPMDSFTVPESLDDAGKAVIRASRELYTKGFQRIYCGPRSIELLALGCMAVTGCSPAVAAHHVVAHFATVASTIPGQLVPYASVAWKEVRGYLSDDAEDMAEIIRSYKPDASADLDRQIAEQREQEAIARDALRRLRTAKGILARRIEIAIRSLDTGNLPSTDAIVWRAITLQETLRALIPEIRDAVSEDEITDIERDIVNEINLANGNQLIGDIQRAIEIQEIMLQREQWETTEITQPEPLAIESANTRSANAVPGRAVQRMRESLTPLYTGACAYKHLLGNVTAMYWIMPTRGYGYMATPSSRTPIVRTCAIHYQNGIDYAQKTGHEQYIILSGQSLRDFAS